ncbi:hypothetical protein NKI95_33195 [Mesorhizobium sp. M0306]|uniref:hypothetical protein n=1 Tax=Mesorhizobium sp. M0306 TaxID=2956932 RepID=UPI00333B73B5
MITGLRIPALPEDIGHVAGEAPRRPQFNHCSLANGQGAVGDTVEFYFSIVEILQNLKRFSRQLSIAARTN